METYSALRHFADTWGLLAMFLAFLGVILWAFRPGSREVHEEAARIPLRNETLPAAPAAAGSTPNTAREDS